MGLRQEKIADEIRDILAKAFFADKMADPRLQGLVVTTVKITGDLQNAKIYFRLYDPSKKDEALKALTHCKGLLKKQLANAIRMRRVPDLIFIYDVSIDQGAHIEGILAKINAGDA